MAVQDEILELITEKFSDKAVTASMIAELKGLSRNTASHHLNRLEKAGFLLKLKEKPTKFFLNQEKTNLADPFEQIVGHEGSMKGIIKQCKAAVTYPNGLPMILNGPSGTGKSFLAKVIYQYAKKNGEINQDAPFCVLNCADYANNPELLSSVLLGHVKGAFTGAEKEKRGLLDEANGGYLFLDEVHNLTPENQEKLFILIDSGRFRRLGDNENWCQTKVRLIFATTEDPRSAMLSTFRRRIPYEVVLPKFSERPYHERLELVQSFLIAESKATQRSIQVDNSLIETLARRDYEGNIGELKNKVKVLVANELPNYQVGELRIPAGLEGQFSQNYQIFTPNDILPQTNDGHVRQAMMDYQLEKVDSFAKLLAQINEILFVIERSVEDDRDAAQKIEFLAYREGTFSELALNTLRAFGFIPRKQEIDQLKAIMQYLVSQGYEFKRLRGLTTQEKLVYRKHLYMAQALLGKLFLAHPLFEQFLSLLTAFFVNCFSTSAKINAVIIMHGKNNAATIAATANEMVGDFVFDYFDMPLTVDTGKIIKQIVNYTHKIDTNQGLVILVDMGSLEKIYSSISGNVSGDLIVMNNVSTALALEVGLQLVRNTPIQQLEQLETTSFQVKKQYFEGVSQQLNILVACISGEGIAVKLKDILSNYLRNEIEVITLDYNLLKEKCDELDEVFFRNTVAILTTPKIVNPNLPIISIEEIISNQNALANLDSFIKPVYLKECMNDILKLFSIEGAASRLSFLNPERVIDEVGEVITAYENYYTMEFPNFVRINLFLHLSSMIERMLKYGSEEMNSYVPPDTQEFHNFCEFSDLLFQKIKQKYNIMIPIAEYGLVFQLVQQSIDY